MSKPITILFGTRPEAIKLAPIILELKKQNIPYRVIHTGQHLELAEQILSAFDITPDHRLKLMTEAQQPLDLLQKLLSTLPDLIAPDHTGLLIVQGDTTSALAGALTAHHQKVKVAHLEAGLRSYDRMQPFPEESNRTLISHLADLHFAPTAGARHNLLAENIDPDTIHVTGNSVVDALHFILDQAFVTPGEIRQKYDAGEGKLILLTTHRRENFGKPLEEIFGAIRDIAEEHPEYTILLPSHPNPNVQQAVKALRQIPNIHVIDPLTYEEFVPLMAAADLILTDSGGIQEEAPALGTPVFVLRNKTERPELLDSGAGKLIGTNKARIIEEVTSHFRRHQANERLEVFGDGHTAERVVRVLKAEVLGIKITQP
ncbi:non-hydrolyzing UDP-N-acetylglucosamine 2-epimerase [Rhodohalobacter sp. 8-1]|uniref:non-hydrolyzing UDP-N-acetylglucosamine 2-epimerase n=1 Tax=Rhodohalobacter sp. 8-1 TaxID=3131972 RepID=UPI0030ED3C86